MQNKTVVITGGTSGIGEVAALNLAGQGARIVLIGSAFPSRNAPDGSPGPAARPACFPPGGPFT